MSTGAKIELGTAGLEALSSIQGERASRALDDARRDGPNGDYKRARRLTEAHDLEHPQVNDGRSMFFLEP